MIESKPNTSSADRATTKVITRREIVLIVLFLSILNIQRMEYESINRSSSSSSSSITLQSTYSSFVADRNATTSKQWNRQKNNKKKTAMCSIVVNEELYLDEFVDYHRALGFDHFLFYDNSDNLELKQWGKLKGDDVWVFPFPGIGRQMEAYRHCARTVKKETNGPFEWVAFFDADEYLVLKQHDHVANMLKQHCSSGVLNVNWYMFLNSDGWNLPNHEPVTRRFLYRETTVNQHVKTIARVQDIADTKLNSDPHNFVELRSGNYHDSNGNPVEGPFHENGPTDVVVLHHYVTKSRKEYLLKKTRGRADLDQTHGKMKNEAEAVIKEARANLDRSLASDALPRNNDTTSGKIFDDSAWKFLKEKVPAYALFDEIGLLPATT